MELLNLKKGTKMQVAEP